MMLIAAAAIMGWLIVIAIGVMVFDLALALLTNPFDVALFAGCFVLVAVLHTAALMLRRRRR